MKMSQAHYAELKARVSDHAAKLPAYIESLRNDPRVKDVGIRARWDAFYAAKIHDVYTYQQFDYLDAHIDTAMRSIFKELGVAP